MNKNIITDIWFSDSFPVWVKVCVKRGCAKLKVGGCKGWLVLDERR
jgi:hypothetical protein